MDTDVQLIARIHTDVVCLPSDVCRIIGSYAVIDRYEWNADNLNAGCRSIPTTDETVLSSTDSGPYTPWYMFVGETTIQKTGYAWNVEFDIWNCGRNPAGWIGVGVTKQTSNCVLPGTGFSSVANQNSYILLARGGSLTTVHADGMYERISWTGRRSDTNPFRFRIWFDFDCRTGVVTARWYNADVETVEPAASFSGFRSPSTNFADLRPCVVLSGCAAAIVRSGRLVSVPPDDSVFGRVVTVRP